MLCAISTNYLIVEKYKKADVKGKSIGVVISRVTINNTEQIAKVLKVEDPQDAFVSFLKTKIKNNILDISLFRKGKSLDDIDEHF